MLTQQRLKELLHYDPDTGDFVWLIKPSKKVKAGARAGYGKHGYIYICINFVEYEAHRLAFLYVSGKFPTEQADHINGIRNDNRWCNLREATTQQNGFNRPKQANNTSGYKGVTWRKSENKWQSQSKLKGRNHYLGLFTDIEAAAKAYQDFAKQHHGEFASSR